ncbi:MAG: MFS transporter [Gammaproteobacteria bacterium]|nr:MFS transporter [Gammaproteobacteria bacterium]
MARWLTLLRQESNSAINGPAERVYSALYEDEDSRVCRDISDDACRVVPGNFFKNVLSQALTKLGDALINPRTTLPWMLTALQAPGWIASLLVPIRESGSMLPQLGIGAWVRRLPRRKWCYVGGALAQGLAAAGLVLVALFLSGQAAGLAVLALVVVFSLARGFSSVASKDVLGKTVPKTRRGRVTGFASSAAGLGTLVFAGVLWFSSDDQRPYAMLLGSAALLWFASAAIYAAIQEEAGATEGGGNGLTQALASLAVLRDDADFRHFLAVRALLVGSGLAAPFLVVLANQRAETSLAYFLLAQGLSALLSGPAWGAFADRSSRRLLMLAGGGAGLLGTGVFLADRLAPELAATAWFLPGAFFVLALLHDGVRLGRKTYVVDLAGGDKRTDYVAVGNTIIGALLLVVGGLTAVIAQFSAAGAILALSLAAFAAAWLSVKLPEVQSL